jgi:hypothetical protein
MANDPANALPKPLQRRDAEVLIGILAVLDGVIWGGSLDEWTTSKVAERLVRHGSLPITIGMTCIGRSTT